MHKPEIDRSLVGMPARISDIDGRPVAELDPTTPVLDPATPVMGRAELPGSATSSLTTAPPGFSPAVQQGQWGRSNVPPTSGGYVQYKPPVAELPS